MAASQAAAALGLGEITGKVAPGYRADLLLVDGDPLADLSALSGVQTVFASGLRHEPNGTGQRNLARVCPVPWPSRVRRDAVLAKVVPWFKDPLAFVSNPERMAYASQSMDLFADDPHSAFFRQARGRRGAPARTSMA